MQSKSINGFRQFSALLASAAALLALLVCAAPAGASFGIEGFDGSVLDEAGNAYTQAGGHPYEISTTISFNSHVDEELSGTLTPDGNVKDILVDLPPGLVGNPSATPRCTAAQLTSVPSACPVSSQIGMVDLRAQFFALFLGRETVHLAVYNMVPPGNVAARFGFNAAGTIVMLDAKVRSGGDYGLTVGARNTVEVPRVLGTTLTFWGVPADPSHDGDRCSVGEFGRTSSPFCEEGERHSAGVPPRVFLTNPTACTPPGVGLQTRLRTSSWENPDSYAEASFFSHQPPAFPQAPGPQVGVTGCDAVSFDPRISVAPSSHAADSPTGLDIGVSIPQEGLESANGIASAHLRKAVVTLPAGMAVAPGAADGLGACSPAEVGLGSEGGASCPDASKIGSVEIDTPLLENPLHGSVFLAKQGDNPFGSLLAMYLVAEGQGVVIKLPGRIDADPGTGRLTATFDNAPQLPFSSLRLSLKGGPRAPLVNPPVCGTATTSAVLTPWSGSPPVEATDSFQVSSGPGGGPCPSAAFAPGFAAGTSNNQAGGFSPFSLTLSRPDGTQVLGGVSVQLPPGLLGILKSVSLCGEPQASAGTCGQESLVGHTTVGAGAGSSPFYLGGSVYLTGPYKGAPFGLSIVVPAIAGPFNLGTVVVRASTAVDPHTARLRVTSDPLPTILQGIPLDLRVVNVTVDRPGFTFNPTNCEVLSVDGTISSAQGASVALANRFQAANCAALPFAPRLSASSVARTSRQGGAALDVKVAYPSGAQANIRSVAVVLPKQLPARLSTVQQACPAATFEANPASCGEGALVGIGTASTPVFAHPLTGPAYLVSHGGESFPDIVVVLQGEGVRIDLVGNVFISKAGVTSATFAHVPDAPISAFDLTLPEGPHSALSAVGSLCAASLAMPTTITAQNGAVVKQGTPIKVSGCTKSKAKKKHKKVRKHKKHKKHKRARKGSASRRK